MSSLDIRQSFVDYFVQRGHRLEPSAPLVPHGDPTLLFTNAGMVPFKDYFLGLDRPPARRAVSVQKCLRVSGKHNDLENVGPSPRHHTFFEMLGNFSFGDYFKEEAIRFGWELVTEVWGLAPANLFATVYEEDDQAFTLWLKQTPLPRERILRCGKKDNFWAMGETGPCGPSSEIFVDLEPELPRVDWEEGTDSGRYLEIWNLVFMQYDRNPEGVLTPLPNPSIDTGAGLERVTAVLEGVKSNYDTDLFQPILHAAAELAATAYGREERADVSLRVIADHLRAVTFLLADGVIPGNEGRGYVLRRLLRRAVRHGMSLGFDGPFLHRLVPVLGGVLGGSYPELGATRQSASGTIMTEEEKFFATVATAAQKVQEAIEEGRRRGQAQLAGATVFRLYDTYGLPIDVIREIAEEERFALDQSGFESHLEEQRQRSRDAAAGGAHHLAAVRELQRAGLELPRTDFLGYDRLSLDGAGVVFLAREEPEGVVPTASLAAGERGVAVLDRSPFYAEAGGQVGDRGAFVWPQGSGEVTDTQKDGTGTSFHFVAVERGTLERGARVEARVAAELRRPTERNHTATHLLHAALRLVLGEGVHQAGSLVEPGRLRFDFTAARPVEPEELRRIEELVNRWVLAAQDTVITPDRAYRDAIAAGAMALFGEKYGERVRTVEVPGVGLEDGRRLASLELCGGCHVRNTGEIGPFVILAERGIASGVRRIEALTGEGALAWIGERRRLVAELEAQLGAPAQRVPQEVASLRERARELERELARLRLQLVSGSAGGGGEQEVEGIRVLVREVPPAPPPELRAMADVLRSRLGSGVVLLGAREDGKVTLVTAVSSDLTGRLHAGKLAGRVAELVGGRGGGRADFAQAGGKDADRLPAALAAVAGLVREALARQGR